MARSQKGPLAGSRALRTPALDAWRRELAAGERTATTFDALWRAACEDMNALEAGRAGLIGTSARCRREAQEIIRRAAREAAR